MITDPTFTPRPDAAAPRVFQYRPILDEFDEAKRDMAENLQAAPRWIERMFSLEPRMLKICRVTLDLAEEKTAGWFSLYMLKGKRQKANSIVKWLGDYELHKTHSRPIMMDDAKKAELKIISLEKKRKITAKKSAIPISGSFRFSCDDGNIYNFQLRENCGKLCRRRFATFG